LPAVRTIPLRPEPLTDAAWEPFGWVPVDDTDARDGALTYEFRWGDPHVNVIRHARDEVEAGDSGLLCDGFYRHDTHTQVLLPLDAASVVAVAPAAVVFAGPEDLDAVRAFHLTPLQAITLGRGTWHWGPFPVDADAVRLFNVQGKRYREDNTHVDLAAALDVRFEVLA
jgi:ureidoglycolate hydrolase